VKSMSRTIVLCCLLLTLGGAQWLERQVVIGDTLGGIGGTSGIVVNPISGNVYIESHPVQIFNPVTLEKLRGPKNAAGTVVFCPSFGKGYVLDDSLLILDAAADTAVGKAVLPYAFVPDVAAWCPTPGRLYLGSSSYYHTQLVVFDPEGDSVTKTIELGHPVGALAWDSVRNRLYIGPASDTGLLRVLDCNADTLLPDVPIGTNRIISLTLSTGSNKLYCAGNGHGNVFIVSTDSLTAIGIVPGLRPGSGYVYSPATDRLYCPGVDTLFVVDCQGDTIRTRRCVPAALPAVSSMDGKVYLGRSDSAQVQVLDSNDSLVGSIPIPAAPTCAIIALRFWPGRNQLYGVASNDDLAFVIDAAADTVAGKVSYAVYRPERMVHNPAGNKLYLRSRSRSDLLVLDSTFGPPKRILGAAGSHAELVLDPALNRLYVTYRGHLRVVDCNADSMIQNLHMYGINEDIPVLVPYLNKLYVFFGSTEVGDSVYAYDGLRERLSSALYLTDGVTCAVYDPRSNRIFFGSDDAPTIRVLDPLTDSIVKTFDLGGRSYRGKMAVNVDLGRLYYTDYKLGLFTIDVLADSVLASETLPWKIDTMFLDRRLQKLYLCSEDTARVLVFDCRKGSIVDTILASYRYDGLLNERNDKLYLKFGAVVDCRYDSVVTMLPDSLSPLSMAWDAIANRVFQATTSRLYVYRDDPYGVEEGPTVPLKRRHATIVRGVLLLPREGLRAALLDISGRKVLDLQPGPNDVRKLAPGIYFVHSQPSAVGRQPSAVTKVVVTR
jgi:DNA-binding beta-propeller fold protein YncE